MIQLKRRKRRFRYVIDPQDDSFDPLYLTATALDPHFALILSDEQVEVAKGELTKELERDYS